MLKETPRSLRSYFILVAVISFIPSMAAISKGETAILTTWPLVLGMTFGLLFTYIAVTFDKQLRKPTLIYGVLWARLALVVISFAFSLRFGVQLVSILSVLLPVLILWYLLKSVARLSGETAQQNA